MLVVFQRSENNHVIGIPVHIKGSIHYKLRIFSELDHRSRSKRQCNIVIYHHITGKNNRKVGFSGPCLIRCNCSSYNKTVDTVPTAGIAGEKRGDVCLVKIGGAPGIVRKNIFHNHGSPVTGCV